MILLFCLWQNNALQSIIALCSFPILHVFFTASLSHLTMTGAMGYCCAKKGASIVGRCNVRMIESVRTLLDLTYSVVLPLWSLCLLVSMQLDVESHAFLYITALGYHLYSTYWAFKNFTWTRTRNFPLINKHNTPIVIGKNKLLHLVLSVVSTFIVITSFKVLSFEMTKWRNSIVPLMLDMHPTSSWAQPTVIQRRALSHHLLAKQSQVVWLLTSNLLVHECPNIFFNLLKLLRLSNYQSNQIKQCVWTTNNYAANCKAAASLGAAAWKRERGISCAPCRKKTNLEEYLSRLHRLSFVIVRVAGGFFTLNRILMSELLVRDTGFVACALLYHGLAVYLCGGIIAYTAKHSRLGRAPNRSLSYQLATSMNDEWLRFT